MSLDSGTILGQGEVLETDLGAEHKLKAEVLAGPGQDTKNNSIVRRFTFKTADGSTDPQTVYLNGYLDGSLFAIENTARASVTPLSV